MSANPDYTFVPNYGGRSMAPVARVYHPWSTALVATLLGYLASFVIGIVLGFLGFAVAVGGGFRNASDTGIVAAAVATYLFVQVLVVVLQARYVGRRGGAHAVLACLAAVAAAVVVGLVSPFGGIETWLLSIGVQVVAIALVSTPGPRR